MSGTVELRVRVAKRTDIPALTDLRVACLAEVARLERRLQLLPDVRERTEHALPVWMDQETRVVLVAEAASGEPGDALLGYATGVSSVWPPLLRNQHVGEVSEVYVLPAHRGRGAGRLLLRTLTRMLCELGAVVLRSTVPSRDPEGLARFQSEGYTPLQYVLQRTLEDA